MKHALYLIGIIYVVILLVGCESPKKLKEIDQVALISLVVHKDVAVLDDEGDILEVKTPDFSERGSRGFITVEERSLYKSFEDNIIELLTNLGITVLTPGQFGGAAPYRSLAKETTLDAESDLYMPADYYELELDEKEQVIQLVESLSTDAVMVVKFQYVVMYIQELFELQKPYLGLRASIYVVDKEGDVILDREVDTMLQESISYSFDSGVVGLLEASEDPAVLQAALLSTLSAKISQYRMN